MKNKTWLIWTIGWAIFWAVGYFALYHNYMPDAWAIAAVVVFVGGFVLNVFDLSDFGPDGLMLVLEIALPVLGFLTLLIGVLNHDTIGYVK